MWAKGCCFQVVGGRPLGCLCSPPTRCGPCGSSRAEPVDPAASPVMLPWQQLIFPPPFDSRHLLGFACPFFTQWILLRHLGTESRRGVSLRSCLAVELLCPVCAPLPPRWTMTDRLCDNLVGRHSMAFGRKQALNTRMDSNFRHGIPPACGGPCVSQWTWRVRPPKDGGIPGCCPA